MFSAAKYLFTTLLMVTLLVAMSMEWSGHAPKMLLSQYGFFEGDIADLSPAEGVVPYSLNSPLFSDYAHKLRFVKLPAGSSVPYNDTEVLQFPVGTTIIKTFYFPHDARDLSKGRRLMETRLLIHEEAGWKALAYHWNAEQTDAVLEVAGASADVKWVDAQGKKQKFTYQMPNVNQCKGCHSWDGAMRPIGPSVRQLNGPLEPGYDTVNQLDKWSALGLISDLPADPAAIPRMASYSDPKSGTVAERARAWLDINCAHCHNPHGPASTSGFFLDVHQQDPSVYGVFKSPVAAGRGSGNFEYDIHPGNPDQSIIVYRIASTDPGIMMPEVGRSLVHAEGVELIKEWIEGME